jgi:hypothetical protein
MWCVGKPGANMSLIKYLILSTFLLDHVYHMPAKEGDEKKYIDLDPEVAKPLVGTGSLAEADDASDGSGAEAIVVTVGDQQVDLSKLKTNELKALAKKLKIAGSANLKKEDLVQAIVMATIASAS